MKHPARAVPDVMFVTNGVITKHATMKRAFGMAPWLVRMGLKVAIALEEHPDNKDRVASLTGVEICWFSSGTPLHELLQKGRIMRAIGARYVHVCGLGWRNMVPGFRSVTGSRLIIDHVELESVLANSPSVRRAAQKALELSALVTFDLQVAASQYLAELIKSHRWLRTKHSVLYLPYGSDPAPITELQVTVLGPTIPRGWSSVLYVGNLYRGYGLFEMVECAKRLKGANERIKIVLTGRGPDWPAAEHIIRDEGLGSHIAHVGYLSEAQLEVAMKEATVFLSPLNDTDADRARCPSKTYMYMAFGKPIVTCDIGENGIALGKKGVYYQPSSCESMVDAMRRAVAMYSSGEDTSFAEESYSWQSRAKRYVSWLQENLVG